MLTDRRFLPPGPKGHWLGGNTFEYDRDRMGFLMRCHDEYGDVFAYDKRTIVVRDPDLVHSLLTRTNEDFSSESSPVATSFDADRSATDSQLWMAARRSGWRGLNQDAAAAHTGRLRQLFDRQLNGTVGREVDVLALMETYSGHAAADFCLSADANGIAEVVVENTRAIAPLSGSSEVLPEWFPSRTLKRFRQARKKTLDVLSGKIAARKSAAAPENPRDLLDVLLTIRPGLSEIQVQRLIRGILLAAYGVPAASMAWTLWTLTTRPALWAMVEAEAMAWGSEEEPALTELPRTEAVVKETLRLWPPTWLMGRTALRATALGKWSLAPETQIMFSPYLMHRDSRWWPDPDTAVPDRWLNGGKPIHKYAYIPFGAGPRVCLGTRLGLTQLVLTMYWLTRNYRVVAPDALAVMPVFHNLLAPYGFQATFVRKCG
ncbi:cytochrome P450 [Amycolatopsis sp. cmx-11-51]|uniref:cytochrome P450 n=1 Tax=Amycolatopsis sp. cmx-11-51 TaxID=2785797 RepID=UPI0039E220D6